jgi:hypothetical protein
MVKRRLDAYVGWRVDVCARVGPSLRRGGGCEGGWCLGTVWWSQFSGR